MTAITRSEGCLSVAGLLVLATLSSVGCKPATHNTHQAKLGVIAKLSADTQPELSPARSQSDTLLSTSAHQIAPAPVNSSPGALPPPPPAPANVQQSGEQRIQQLQAVLRGGQSVDPIGKGPLPGPSAGQSVVVNWWAFPAGQPLPFGDMIDGGHDNDQNVEEYVCSVNMVIGSNVVPVPGKLEGAHCDATYSGEYVESTVFSVAVRYPSGAQGHWNGLTAHPQSAMLTSTKDNHGNVLIPCSASFTEQLSGLDELEARLQFKSILIDHGTHLGYLQGSSCLFQWGPGYASSGDGLMVYYKLPPPPTPAKPKPPTPGPKQGSMFTYVNHRGIDLTIWRVEHAGPGATPACGDYSNAGAIADGQSWTVSVAFGYIDQFQFTPTSSSGACDGVVFYNSVQGAGPGYNATYTIPPA